MAAGSGSAANEDCKLLSVVFLLLGVVPPAFAASVFTTKLDDPKAVTLSGAKGDGKADDSAAIQAARDKADTGSDAIVFIPSGRYRLTRTIYVWPGDAGDSASARRARSLCCPPTRRAFRTASPTW